MQRFHLLTLLPLVLLGAAPLTFGTPAPAGTQCKPGETVVYSCKFGKSVGSACMSATSLSYRFGPAGHPTIEIRSNADWSNVHLGGHYSNALAQDYVRFTSNGYAYVIHDSEAGSLSDVPGKRFSGIAVVHGKSDVANLECHGRPVRLESWSSRVFDRATAATHGRADLHDEDPRFDIYF